MNLPPNKHAALLFIHCKDDLVWNEQEYKEVNLLGTCYNSQSFYFERYYYNSTIPHLHGSLCNQLVRCNVSRLYCTTGASLQKLFEKTYGETFVI
jgi:hypothetical protein